MTNHPAHKINDSTLDEILSDLSYDKYITALTLDLRANELTDFGTESLRDLLLISGNQLKLKKLILDLRGNKISDIGIMRLIEGVKANTYLDRLEVQLKEGSSPQNFELTI